MAKPNTKKRPGYVAPAKGVALHHGIYTEGELYRLARSVGLSPAKATIAAAVAMAESGGNPHAVSSTGDVGLWQINQPTWGHTPQQLKDPAFNARLMAQISKKGTDWSPWTQYRTGAYRKYLRGNLKDAKGGHTPAGKVATSAPNLPSPQVAAALGGLPGTQFASIQGDILGGIENGIQNGLNPLGAIPGLGGFGSGGILDNTIGNLFPVQIMDTFRLFNHLFEPAFWFKVGKVVLGIVALYIGLNMLLKLSTGIDVTRSAKHAAGTAASVAAVAVPK